jgi:hypothetical protein
VLDPICKLCFIHYFILLALNKKSVYFVNMLETLEYFVHKNEDISVSIRFNTSFIDPTVRVELKYCGI